MPKLTQVINGEYIGGDKYVINQVGNGKSTVVFSPDQTIKAGTPVGAEILNEMQKNGLYTLRGTRGIVGVEEQYSINFEGFDSFECEELNCLFIPDADSTGNQISLLINQVKYTFNEVPNFTANKIYEIILKKSTKTVEFRKNQSRLISVDTIAELQARKNLKVGDVVEVLGYYTAGDGANHKRIIASEDDGSGVQLANGLWANIIHNGEVNVSWFGAKGDGVSDDTQIIRKAIKFMYSSVEQIGWRREVVIKFPIGTFIINGSVIDNNLSVAGGRFTFSGNGMASTVIKFTGTLFDNDAIFGFTQFEKMQFISDNTGTFMRFVGGGSGNAQGLNFNLCRFESMKTIINASGNTMCSEVTFSQCRIAMFNETSIIFILNNAQGVNWRFIATDIESFAGTCFQYLKGSAVSVFHGSIIPQNNGKVIEIPSTANSDYFAGGNNPIIAFYSSRFEMRDFSKLIHKQSFNVYFSAIFENCGMGGANLQEYGIEHYPIDITGEGNVVFSNCDNLNKYRMKHIARDSSGESPKIYFNNCLPKDELSLFLKNSFLEGVTHNFFRYPEINWNNVIFSAECIFMNNSKNTLTLTNCINIAKGNNSINEVYSTNLCGKSLFNLFIREVIITNYGKAGYGNPDLTFTLYNEDKTKVLASETIKFETKKSYKFQVAEMVKGFILEASTNYTYDNIIYLPITVEVI